MRPFASYCTALSIAGIVLNVFFLVVSRLKRVEGFQEVLVFMRNIAVGYILVALVALTVAPQSITIGTCNVHIPYGLLAQADSSTLAGISSFGVGCYLYTVLCFCVMFLYRYNVTCKTASMSTLFGRKNIAIFLSAAALFSIVQSVLLYYSFVDSSYLLERLNRSRQEMDGLQLSVSSDSVGGGGLALFNTNSNFNSNSTTENEREMSNLASQLLHQQQFRGGGGGESFGPNTQANGGNSRGMAIGVFGTDYTRNPMLFLSVGIFSASNLLSATITLIVSLVIVCKLRGKQENMSDKSKQEHQRLTTVLILGAYLPMALIAVSAANYFVAIFRHESMPYQGYLGTMLLAPIAVIFPLVNILLLPGLRSTAFYLVVCMYWRKKRDEAEKERQAKAVGHEELNASQRKIVDGMTKHARRVTTPAPVLNSNTNHSSSNTNSVASE